MQGLLIIPLIPRQLVSTNFTAKTMHQFSNYASPVLRVIVVFEPNPAVLGRGRGWPLNQSIHQFITSSTQGKMQDESAYVNTVLNKRSHFRFCEPTDFESISWWAWCIHSHWNTRQSLAFLWCSKLVNKTGCFFRAVQWFGKQWHFAGRHFLIHAQALIYNIFSFLGEVDPTFNRLKHTDLLLPLHKNKQMRPHTWTLPLPSCIILPPTRIIIFLIKCIKRKPICNLLLQFCNSVDV